MNWIRAAWGDLKEAGQGMVRDSSTTMGAALAYYTMFSIAPLLVIAIGLAGLVFGQGAGHRVFTTLQGFVGTNGATAIESMVRAATQHRGEGLVATSIGIVTLIIGASSVFQQLQQSLNIIWKVTPKPEAGWWQFIRQRLFSFAMVAVLGFVMLVSLLVSAALGALDQWTVGALPGGQALWRMINVIVTLVITGGLFSAVFKYIPDVRLRWRDVWAGGLLTAVLFVIGKAAFGTYIGKSGVASSYGAAGSLIIILLWVYYSSQILFFGAEWTRAGALRTNRTILPSHGSMFALSPVQAASMAKASSPGNRSLKDKIPASDLYAAEGLAALAAVLLAKGLKKPGRTFAGGVAAGVSLGIFWVLASAGVLGQAPQKPSTVSRLVKKIPLKVKVAAVAGGVRGGSLEAGRELRDRFSSKSGES